MSGWRLFLARLLLSATIPMMMAFAFSALIGVALSHSWYPTACCSGMDCELIPLDGVAQTAKGYHVKYVSKLHGEVDEMIPMSIVQASRDGQFHGCFRKPWIKPRPICFFAPLSM